MIFKLMVAFKLQNEKLDLDHGCIGVNWFELK